MLGVAFALPRERIAAHEQHVDLPGIASARVWEPEPARVYRWELH